MKHKIVRCRTDLNTSNSTLLKDILSESAKNWSSWTGLPLTPEQIYNSISDFALENALVTFPTKKNIDVYSFELTGISSKSDSPTHVVGTNDVNSITIGIHDYLSVNFDHKGVNPHSSHHVTCSNICEQQTSSAFLSSNNNKGRIEFGLALEGLKGITTALDRKLDSYR